MSKKVVKTYHGRMTKPSRKAVEEEFSCGAVRVLVATVAYALGVNPAAVQYVIQRGQCSTDEALQKLGRANRKSDLDHVVFYWLPDTIVVGPMQVPGHRPRTYKYPRLEVRTAASVHNSSTRYPSPSGGASDTDSDAASVVSTQTIPSTPLSNKRTRKPGSTRVAVSRAKQPARWRYENLTDGMWDVYNGSCHWRAVLGQYSEPEPLVQPCGNCNGQACSPGYPELVELGGDAVNTSGHPEMAAYVTSRLLELAVVLGREQNGALSVYCEPEESERVIPKEWREKFGRSYVQVGTGDRLGWLWDNTYGPQVTAWIRCLVAPQLDHLPVREIDPVPDWHDAFSPPPIVPAMAPAVPQSLSTPAALRDISNRYTARGTLSLVKKKGSRKRLRD